MGAFLVDSASLHSGLCSRGNGALNADGLLDGYGGQMVSRS